MATTIAKKYIEGLGWGAEVESYDARDLVAGLRRPQIYGLRDHDRVLATCWIVYVNYREPREVGPSTIALVSKATGEVLYVGQAGDEG